LAERLVSISLYFLGGIVYLFSVTWS